MKMTKIMAASSVAAFLVSCPAMASLATNDWFAVDFETGYADNQLVTNGTAAGGSWTSIGGAGASKVVDLAGESLGTTTYADGNVAKLDEIGGSLKWTPTAASTAPTVYVDTGIYLVGSESLPTSSATGDIQTEVFLKNFLDANYNVTRSALYAHVKDAVGNTNMWVELSGVTVADNSWVKLRIEIDYADAANPLVSYFVNNTKMFSGATSAFPVMIQTVTATAINSVSFTGTGYLDNFVGKEVVQHAGTGLTVPAGGANSVDYTLPATSGADGLAYIKIAKGDGTYYTYRITDETADGQGNFTLPIDTSALAAGTYTVDAFYGTAASVIPAGYVPAVSKVGANKAATVANGNLTLTVAAPVSGLYYTPFVGTDTLGTLVAGAASSLATITVENLGYLQVTIPAPTQANGVKLIKIYASDEPFASGDPAPVAQ